MKSNALISIIILLLIGFSKLVAEEDNSSKFALKTSANTIGTGTLYINDPYLSPIPYSGHTMSFQNNTRQLLKPSNDRLSLSQSAKLELASLTNPAGNNRMLALYTDYSIGINYHLRPAQDLMILVGGNIDWNLGVNYLARNVNNPASVHLSNNINVATEIQYLLTVFGQSIRLQYGITSPVLGVMFVPKQNATYYEMFELNNLQGTIHPSSLHNKQSIDGYFNIDYPFRFTTLRLSTRHQNLRYQANEMVFRRNSYSASLGWIVFLQRFRTKETFPSSFKHAYE